VYIYIHSSLYYIFFSLSFKPPQSGGVLNPKRIKPKKIHYDCLEIDEFGHKWGKRRTKYGLYTRIIGKRGNCGVEPEVRSVGERRPENGEKAKNLSVNREEPIKEI
jgi:hypothetical protein